MNVLTVVVTIFLFLIQMAYGRHCTYIYESGYMKYFYCNSYEYCCGAMCCRSQAVTFYQVWYFWLIVFLTLLLCSGGSWWYRFHHREPFINPTITTADINTATAPALPIIQPAGIAYGSAINHPPFYPHTQLPAQHLPPVQPQFQPPPPYYEPPPSYAAATTAKRSG